MYGHNFPFAGGLWLSYPIPLHRRLITDFFASFSHADICRKHHEWAPGMVRIRQGRSQRLRGQWDQKLQREASACVCAKRWGQVSIVHRWNSTLLEFTLHYLTGSAGFQFRHWVTVQICSCNFSCFIHSDASIVSQYVWAKNQCRALSQVQKVIIVSC